MDPRLPGPHRGTAVAVPLLAHLLCLRARSGGAPRCSPWWVAHDPSCRPVPALGWEGLGPGARPHPADRALPGAGVVTLPVLLAAQKKFWILDPLYRALGEILAWIYGVIHSYGVAIVLLTVVVRLVLYPLTVKQTKSMQAMQKVQPELKRLQQKYKNDKQKLNEEMMKFYREHHINPLAGCLPLLLQMPLFFVLYRLIHDLTKTVILGAVVAGGVGSGPPVTQPQIVHVVVHGGTLTHGHVTDASLTGDVQVGGQTVGRLADAQVTDGKVHGPKSSDPVR